MNEYKSNSHRSKEEQREKITKKVVTGKAKTKKKNEIQKFADVFISEDLSNVKNYIFMDVLVPAIKKAISDIVTEGIDMILYSGSRRNPKKSSASKISYRSYYDKNNHQDYTPVRIRSSFDYDDIIFNSRGDAEVVLNTMEDIIEQYGVVSVGDLYDLADIPTTNYTINKYGWTNLKSASVLRVKDGYMIKLPKALSLN